MRLMRWLWVCVVSVAGVVGMAVAAPPATAPAGEYAETVLAAHLDVPIEPGKNVVWCASLQVAWDELTRWNGADVLLEGDPPEAAGLAASRFPRAWVGEEDLIAEAGVMDEALITRIQRQFHDKFGGRQDAQRPGLTANNALGMYAYLHKQLAFDQPFGQTQTDFQYVLSVTQKEDRYDARLDREAKVFEVKTHRQPVAAFGLESLDSDNEEELRLAKQVRVLWFDREAQFTPDSFGVELLALGGDRIILATLDYDLASPPGEWTLRRAVNQVINRMERSTLNDLTPHHLRTLGTAMRTMCDALQALGLQTEALDGVALQTWAASDHSRHLQNEESLTVPVLRLGLVRSFESLQGRDVRSGRAAGMPLLTLTQRIDLSLNETGARLTSELFGLFGPSPRHLRFDRNFILLLQRKDARQPYFVAWVGNTEFMQILDPQTETFEITR
jgi:hypothetical protein